MAWIQYSRGQYFVCWREGGRGSPKKVQAAGAKLSEARRMRDVIAGRVREGRVGGGVLPKKITFSEFCGPLDVVSKENKGWLAGRTVRPKTLEREKYLIKNHLLPAFGASMLYGITGNEVQAFITDLGKRVSAYTARRVHDVLRVMLGDAKRYGYLRENVAWDTRRPELPHHEMKILSVNEMCRLLEALPRRWKALVLTMLLTGLRWGEAAGLQWTDLDLETGRLHVRRQIVSNTTAVAQPKSKKSLRTIDLLPPVREALLDVGQRGTWVFPGVRGGPLNHRAFVRRVWLPTVRALGIDLRVHDLRHAFASLLLSWGRNPVYVAAQMGHGSADVTLKVYGHLMREAQRLDETHTLRKIEEAYGCAKPVPSKQENNGSGESRNVAMIAGRGGRI